MKKRYFSAVLVILVTLSLIISCGGNQQSGGGKSSGAAVIKESPMLSQLVSEGKLPELSQRIPIERDVYVETDMSVDNPQFGGVFRQNNGGLWDYGPFCEEPLFRLTDDGGIAPNVAKSYEVSADGLTYTIKLREGMKWSDGQPFTAEDCVYYYNYMLITGVNWQTGRVSSTYTTNYFNWYMSTDPKDGILKPAIVELVDATTFTIKLLSPKPILLQNIAIDNKWMFAPKHWYKDIVAFDSAAAHWSGITDIAKIGGAGLTNVSQEQAVANAAAKNSLYKFDNYNSLGKELGYEYWKYAGRPTLRAWNNTSPLTQNVLVFERNPYFWKVDGKGRQLPYIDKFEAVSMAAGLFAQELIAGNLDMAPVALEQYPTFKASEATGNFTIKGNVQPNWTACAVELNTTYKDPQYAELFTMIDFRHALSIAADRNEMNEILYNGMAEPSQAVPPKGTAQYNEAATKKWIEQDVKGANALLDGISAISKNLNADGFRTFTGGANRGKPVTIIIETHAGRPQTSQAAALLAQYYKAIGIQLIESSNQNRPNRNQKIFAGDQVMANMEELLNVFNPAVRPDRVGANRNLNTWLGKYSIEFRDHKTPAPGTPLAGIVDATNELTKATTLAELNAAGDKLLQNHFDNTWYIGYLAGKMKYTALNNKIKNYDESKLSCDEVRFFGNTKPYIWYIAE